MKTIKGYNKKVYRTISIDVDDDGKCRAFYEEQEFVPGVKLTVHSAVNGATITRYNEGEKATAFVATTQYDMNNIIEKLVQRWVVIDREFKTDEYGEDTLDQLREAGATGIPIKEAELTA